MDDEQADHTPWTPDGAEHLTAAADRLAAGVKAHAAAIASAADADFPTVIAATEALLPLVLAYADAQFDYTGNGFPFGVLHQFTADEDDEEDQPPTEDRPRSGISVLRRHDYGVTDEASALAAGRAAYLRAWPESSEEDAAAEVTHLGIALYQVAHAGGWDALDRVAGLRPLGGLTRILDQAEPLRAGPADPFATEGAVIFEQSDVWG